jgi:hypothetical protein
MFVDRFSSLTMMTESEDDEKGQREKTQSFEAFHPCKQVVGSNQTRRSTRAISRLFSTADLALVRLIIHLSDQNNLKQLASLVTPAISLD